MYDLLTREEPRPNSLIMTHKEVLLGLPYFAGDVKAKDARRRHLEWLTNSPINPRSADGTSYLIAMAVILSASYRTRV